ncbi:MAG: hypothetical protein P8K68_13315 [Algibacter sp.]|uniref:hypothetical protein n=1 Tax=Algibacter sp. TaxID=1872428 RepID=UPI002610E9F5|nr:hypothetical protein [Algibacter sp.]MDG1731128.1 hypothetical protein [Algibacter sp.]MDG2179746.1 hypothetical protein [Algibacter sp.]
MRCLYVFFMMFFLVSCKTKSEVKSNRAKDVVNMVCPERGTCSFELFKNKALQLKTDNLGDIYPEMIDGGHFVLKFEYKKKGNTNYQDSSYREEVFVELDKNNLEFETQDLLNKTLFFARWCYCKGQTGYFKINHGKLSVIKKDDKNFHLDLSFKVEEVPQVIKEIKHTFSIQ